MEKFTDEKFEGITFECTTEPATIGFAHVCRAIKDGEEIASNRIVWGNRTWEHYRYEEVLNGCKAKLEAKDEAKSFSSNVYGFYNDLANDNNIINDFGTTIDDEDILIFDSWTQVYTLETLLGIEPNEKITLSEHDVNTFEKYLKENNCTVEEARQLYEEVGVQFTDEWNYCSGCGRYAYSTDTHVVNYETICSKCVQDPSKDYAYTMIEEAQEDYSKAITPIVDKDFLEKQGYTIICDKGCNEHRMFGAYAFENNGDYEVNLTKKVFDLIDKSFVALTGVGQFQTYFNFLVPDEYADIAQKYFDDEITWDELVIQVGV